jgi:hypothetical protein
MPAIGSFIVASLQIESVIPGGLVQIILPRLITIYVCQVPITNQRPVEAATHTRTVRKAHPSIKIT